MVMKRGFVKLLFGVTRLKNGWFMVQDIYVGGEPSVNTKVIGKYSTADEANFQYRKHAPNNTIVR
jgi:hypothetical protein